MQEFEDIDLRHVAPYMERWERTATPASDYSFPILWGWAKDYGYQVAVEKSDDLFWIRQTIPRLYNLAPIGDWRRNDWAELVSANYGKKCKFWLVPEQLLDIWRAQFGSRIEAESDRGNWEYLYSLRELASLSGNKYMKKRNRVNQFRRSYDYVYRPIDCALIPSVLEFHNVWCQANGCANTPTLQQEANGISRILSHWGEIPHLRGGVIEVGGKIVAYTVGELSGKETLIIHFEKASLEYGAAYQVINKEFLVHMLEREPELVTVNREEDMNDQGLREAKLSYLPVGFIKKYRVKISL